MHEVRDRKVHDVRNRCCTGEESCDVEGVLGARTSDALHKCMEEWYEACRGDVRRHISSTLHDERVCGV